MDTIKDILSKTNLTVSFEIFPPKGNLTDEAARDVVKALSQLRPSFISVTCSAGGSGNSANTSAVASMVQDEFATPSVAHMTCAQATPETLQGSIADFQARGLRNVLALRGDLQEGQQPPYCRHAVDLIPHLKQAGFCVGAAAYPEGHIDCEDPALSIEHLKQKQEAGADFFVTQLAFDNEYIFRFLEAADAAGITQPITCGIMPFLSKPQIERMVFMCGASLPSPIIKLLAKHKDDPEALRSAGIQYACRQIVDLAQHGVRGIHVYCMNQPNIARCAVEALRTAGVMELTGGFGASAGKEASVSFEAIKPAASSNTLDSSPSSNPGSAPEVRS